jgi:hypothetical protein
MTGSIPVFKLHGSLNWSLTDDRIGVYQDMRPAYRHGGTAAIVPPIPEKLVPPWLDSIWRGAAKSLSRSNIWIVCGYSAPAYDTEVLRLLREAGTSRPLTIFLLSPDSADLHGKWIGILPQAQIACLPGLPQGIEQLAKQLADLD